ncbi:protein farnesyltransferase subunit beta, partial [Teratosphaeria destructans]
MANDTPNDSPKDDPKIVELSDSDDDDDNNNDDDATSSPPPTSRRIDPDSLPPWLHQATLALFHDDLETATSEARHKTQTDCLPYLTGAALAPFDLNAHGIPHLRREPTSTSCTPPSPP